MKRLQYDSTAHLLGVTTARISFGFDLTVVLPMRCSGLSPKQRQSRRLVRLVCFLFPEYVCMHDTVRRQVGHGKKRGGGFIDPTRVEDFVLIGQRGGIK